LLDLNRGAHRNLAWDHRLLGRTLERVAQAGGIVRALVTRI
jgi:hypothetical protein